MTTKKILFLLKSEKTPSSRIRFIELIPLLEKCGLQIEVEYIPKAFFERRRIFKRASEFDLTIFQKRLFSFFEFAELRRHARKLAFDCDDAVFLKNAAPSQNRDDYFSATRKRRFKRICSHADLVIVANNYLANECNALAPGKAVEVIPSAVDIARITQKKDYSLHSPAILGWIGSKVTHRYLEHIAPALCELSRKYDFLLHVISDKELILPGLDIKNITWSKESEARELSKFDIGIMPLSEDPFSKGKASYKLLQYMAAGIPSVASAVGMNIDVAGDNEFALLAENDADFATAIMRLIESCELRTSIGVKARTKIENEFSKEVISAKLADAIFRCLDAESPSARPDRGCEANGRI